MGAPYPSKDATAPGMCEAAAGFDSLSPLRHTLYPQTYDKAARRPDCIRTADTGQLR